jgi:hypothetical protein
MRIMLLALSAALVGCAKEPAAEKTESAPTASLETPVAADDPWPDGFPMLATDYSGVFEMALGAAPADVTIAASGMKRRIEFPAGASPGPGSQWPQVIVNEGGDTLMWPAGAEAPKIAMKLAGSDLGAAARAFGVDPAEQAQAQKTGVDEIAGEPCAVYEFAGDDPATSVCVTRDGILLRAASGADIVMLAKSITRGAQDPSLFSPPAGYEIVDMGECMRLSAEMMAAAQAGQSPDMAKMAKCQALGEKMGALYSPQ